jgi:hypothetical protein
VRYKTRGWIFSSKEHDPITVVSCDADTRGTSSSAPDFGQNVLAMFLGPVNGCLRLRVKPLIRFGKIVWMRLIESADRFE